MSNLNILWDDYQIYKGVKIYPFLMKDYDIFEDLISILLFNKNNIGDVEIIKMSYLKFLVFLSSQLINDNGDVVYKNILIKLQELFKYVLKDQESIIEINEKGKLFLHIKTENEDIFLSENDFDKLKKIILIQNAIPIFNNKLHPDLQKELEENMKFIANKQNNQDGTIEDLIVSYKCEMKFDSYKPIKEMTIYQFRKELARLDIIKDYQIYKQAECSGMVSFSKPIPHWLSHKSNEPDYSNLLMNKKDFDAKMNQFSKE